MRGNITPRSSWISCNFALWFRGIMLTRRLGWRLGQLAWGLFAGSFVAGACGNKDDNPPVLTGSGEVGTGGRGQTFGAGGRGSGGKGGEAGAMPGGNAGAGMSGTDAEGGTGDM